MILKYASFVPVLCHVTFRSLTSDFTYCGQIQVTCQFLYDLQDKYTQGAHPFILCVSSDNMITHDERLCDYFYKKHIHSLHKYVCWCDIKQSDDHAEVVCTYSEIRAQENNPTFLQQQEKARYEVWSYSRASQNRANLGNAGY